MHRLLPLALGLAIASGCSAPRPGAPPLRVEHDAPEGRLTPGHDVRFDARIVNASGRAVTLTRGSVPVRARLVREHGAPGWVEAYEYAPGAVPLALVVVELAPGASDGPHAFDLPVPDVEGRFWLWVCADGLQLDGGPGGRATCAPPVLWEIGG